MAERVCLGAILGAHGVRGEVKVRSFTADPADIAAYGPVEDETGTRRLDLAITGQPKPGVVTVKVRGIADRNAAEALKGLTLYVPRDALPEPEEDEFYYSDLVGLAAETVAGDSLGRVRAVHDFGAGAVLEVIPQDGGPALMFAFTRTVVPVVDVRGGRLVVDPPAELEAREDAQDGG